MSLKTQIAKWVFLSCGKHFTDSISGITTYVENTERTLSDEFDWIEIRIDGPDIREISNGYYKIYSEINLLVCTHMNPTSPTRHFINVGKAINCFDDFLLYRYGDETDDDNSQLCLFRLQPTRDLREKVAVSNMGQIDQSLKLIQTTIEGHFEAFLEEE